MARSPQRLITKPKSLNPHLLVANFITSTEPAYIHEFDF